MKEPLRPLGCTILRAPTVHLTECAFAAVVAFLFFMTGVGFAGVDGGGVNSKTCPTSHWITASGKCAQPLLSDIGGIPWSPQIHESLGGTNIGHHLVWADQNTVLHADSLLIESHDASLNVIASAGGRPAVNDMPGVLFRVAGVNYPLTYRVTATDAASGHVALAINTGLCLLLRPAHGPGPDGKTPAGRLDAALANDKDEYGIGYTASQAPCGTQASAAGWIFDVPFGNQDFKQVSVSTGFPAIVKLDRHGFVAGQAITFLPATFFTTAVAPPAPLAPDTAYYVLAAGLTDNTFELSTRPGGEPIRVTGRAVTSTFIHPSEVSPISSGGTIMTVGSAAGGPLPAQLDGNPIIQGIRKVPSRRLQPEDKLLQLIGEWKGYNQDIFAGSFILKGGPNYSAYWEIGDTAPGGVGNIALRIQNGVNLIKGGSPCAADAAGQLTACSAVIGGVGTPVSVPNGNISAGGVVIAAGGFRSGGKIGYTGSKVIGGCTITFTGGLVTAITGC